MFSAPMMSTPSVPIPLMDSPRPGLSEFDRIDRFMKPLTRGYPGALALSDDAALLVPEAGWEIVVTTDALVAGVHFLATDAPEDTAAKLLRTNLSDLAAMAADPFGYMLTVVLPRVVDDAWLSRFTAALAEDQARYGVHLIGGDSVKTDGPIVLSVTAFGRVPAGTAVLRSGARPGDTVFVTGTIGDAAMALRDVLGERSIEDPEHRTALLQRLRRPTPRVAFGRALRGIASAAIDVSDGLVADLGHVCTASGCSATIEATRVPFSPAVTALIATEPALLGRAVTGGDDYELLFTVPPGRRAALDAVAAAADPVVTEIGRIEGAATPRVRLVGADGAAMALTQTGWSHF